MPDSQSSDHTVKTVPSDWKEQVLQYQTPSLWRAIWQITNSFTLYALFWYLAYTTLIDSIWLSMLFSTCAAGMLIRIFIIFHDCGHGSFFKSAMANNVVGFITGALTLTPYYQWRWEHSVHHATSGNLDKRGIGDIWTLTMKEYLEGSAFLRFRYKVARNPVVIFVIAPVLLFALYQRIPNPKGNPREKRSVHTMNVAILVMAVGMSYLIGWQSYLLIQLFITAVGSGAGIWMFYVQHQFDDTHWEHTEEWDYATAAIHGSSFYKLPKFWTWVTGNIGYHHIHHLSSRIPNYNLARAHRELPFSNEIIPLTFWKSLKSLTLRLWDEEQKKLVGYREMRVKRNALKQAALEAGVAELQQRKAGNSGKA
jgi:acyl-lipid omega-6 desaturase (Delta-12 desaturase)